MVNTFERALPKTKDDEQLDPPNRAAESLRDKTVFITGGTGFMGQVLLEKLLRSCPGVKRIYMLVRSKKGKNAQDRIKDMFTNPLYKLLKETRGEAILNKVVAIAGDVSEIGIGIAQSDRKTLAQEVQFIFHFAATVRFDDPLKKAILTNTRGTKYMLDLAKQCHNLKVFIHMSTAYCHLKEKVLYEKIYPPPADPHAVIKIAECLDESVLETLKDKLLCGEPNGYTFSKALGESLVTDEFGKLPIRILRFSVVIPILREPIKGWTNNINGPTGLLIAAGKGVLRTMYCNPKGYADFIPVDVAANVAILATSDVVPYEKCRIYNCTSTDKYQITWSDIIELGRKVVETKMPLNGVMWYPGGSMKRSKLLHWISVLLFHYLPALVLDPLIWLSGNKPVLWRVQQRLTNAFELFEFFANNQWNFNNEVANEDKKLLNETERNIYDVEGENIDFEDYFYHCTHAARLYILKESDETIPAAKAHMRRMWYLDKFCKTMIVLGFIYCLWMYIIAPVIDLVF